MNCNCGKEISSPKLTGELCATCFFEQKRQEKKYELYQRGIPYLDMREVLADDTTRPVTAQLEEEHEGKEYSEENETPRDDEEIEPEKPPIVSKNTETKDPNLKYCQSCIERGYGLVLATREWQTNYFICDDCFTPLLNNILSVTDNDIQKIKTEIKSANGPFLTQAYDLLEIPEPLRFSKSDHVLNARNDIFNYHAPSLVNKNVEQIATEIENLSIILFQIKLAIEPRQDYINKIKYHEREKAGLKGLEKSEKEYTKGPSKLKQSTDQKRADTLFKATISDPAERLKVYLEMSKKAKTLEFDKIVNS